MLSATTAWLDKPSKKNATKPVMAIAPDFFKQAFCSLFSSCLLTLLVCKKINFLQSNILTRFANILTCIQPMSIIKIISFQPNRGLIQQYYHQPLVLPELNTKKFVLQRFQSQNTHYIDWTKLIKKRYLDSNRKVLFDPLRRKSFHFTLPYQG